MSNRMPVVRQTSWVAVTLHAVLLAGAVCGVCAAVGWPEGLVLGSGAYLAYSFGSRAIACHHHRRGLSLTAAGRYEDAIRQHEASYGFFVRHEWLDRFRAVSLLSPSAVSYREMALLNIAFCYGQLGDGQSAKEYYERVLREFPESSMAKSALSLIGSVQRQGRDGCCQG